ncbi:uncharacterized protein LOC125661248 isoform X2 [Ostrea edulis]|uniref:uncharacterized protein LOC125661248 isoform X2 n=1 Tax=Ostrea edulis TaxID=37623 RepID=UPI0020947115|nr:uncharacterized protein LOC125661248 isoform X2 [Ostrea edulis]
MLLLVVISSITVLGVQGQLNATQNGGITNGVSNTQPTLNNADAIKVAETLVQTANQLLSILKRGNAPTVLCPNGRPQTHCDPDPCATWDCSNIAGVQCERACDSCDPIFKTRGRDVTSICEMRRVPVNPFQLMNAPISPFDSFASEGFHPIERLFLRGNFPNK